MKYCTQCGAEVTQMIPDNDNRQRFVCTDCNFIHYENPKVVAGVIPVFDQKIVLCKRAIEPRYGLWTLPAGFMENDETLEQAAVRESVEEANLALDNLQLYTLISLPHINQLYVMFRARVMSEDFSPGAESLETRLFTEQDIPWEKLAFPVIHKTLECFYADRRSNEFKIRNLSYHVRKAPNRPRDILI